VCKLSTSVTFDMDAARVAQQDLALPGFARRSAAASEFVRSTFDDLNKLHHKGVFDVAAAVRIVKRVVSAWHEPERGADSWRDPRGTRRCFALAK